MVIKAKELLDKYGAMPADLKTALEGLTDIPTDLRASYPIENQMKAW